MTIREKPSQGRLEKAIARTGKANNNWEGSLHFDMDKANNFREKKACNGKKGDPEKLKIGIFYT